MQDRFKNFAKRKGHLLFPWLLATVLTVTCFSAYGIKPFSIWTFGAAIMTTFAFLVGEYTNKHRVKGGLLIFVLTVAIIMLYSSLARGDDYGVSFQQWFLTGADVVENKNSYLLAITLSFGAFFGIVIYYFANILYRMAFITLVSLIPLVLHVKVLSEVNLAYVAVIALLDVAVYAANNRKAERGRYIGLGSHIFSFGMFFGMVLLLAVIIPKKPEAKYYYIFENLFMGGNMSITLPENYSVFSEYSGNADNYNELANRRIYSVYSDDTIYFKRQTFDYYDFDRDAWYADEYYSEPVYTMKEYAENAENLNLSMLKNAVIKANTYESGFAEQYGLSELVSSERFTDREQMVFVQAENFPSVAYIVPARAISIQYNSNYEEIYVTRSGVFRNKENVSQNYNSFNVRYYDEFEARFRFLELGGADFDDETELEFLTELYRILNNRGDEYAKVAKAYLTQCEEAREYEKQTAQNTGHISDRVRELAENITKDCTYDWEKAEALCDYFTDNGFKYDLDYVAEDDSPEYFLFESKTGTCSDFAGAYVLMARSVGLNVRYAEGYVPDDTNIEGFKVIRLSCSHAYPEVYIQNMGYVVYEPTISSEYNNFAVSNTLSYVMEAGYNAVRILVATAFVVVVLLLIVLLFTPFMHEALFRVKVKHQTAQKAVISMYGRIIKKSEGVIGKKLYALTPHQFAEKFLTLTTFELDIVPLVEKTAYNDYTPNNDEKKSAYACYRQAMAVLRNYKKQKKKCKQWKM